MRVAFLLLLCLALGGIVAAELRAPDAAAVDMARAEIPSLRIEDLTADQPPTAAAEAPPRDTYDVIAARPLFVKTRRPAASAQPQRDSSLSSWRLLGTVISAAGGGFAVISPGADLDAVTLRPGEVLEDWRLAAIESDHIDLTREGKLHRLELDPPDATPTSADAPSSGRRASRPPTPAPASLRPDD